MLVLQECSLGSSSHEAGKTDSLKTASSLLFDKTETSTLNSALRELGERGLLFFDRRLKIDPRFFFASGVFLVDEEFGDVGGELGSIGCVMEIVFNLMENVMRRGLEKRNN